MRLFKLSALLVLLLAATLVLFAACGQDDVPGTDGNNDHVHAFKDATCTAPKTCECGATEGNPLGHTIVTDKAVDATCTETGLSAGTHCSVCNEVLTKQTVIEAKGHDYTSVVTFPACTEGGYTTHTCACGDTYKDSEVAALGHSFVEGTCSACGEADPDYVKPEEPSIPSGGEADFSTIQLPANKPNGDSSYSATYNTANGWISANAAIQCGGSTVMNPQFPVIGADSSFKAICLNGKVSAPGSLTSPTLSGGLSKLTISYTKMFTDTKLSITITVTDLTTGSVYTHTVAREEDKNTKYEVWTDEWVLEPPITGDFTIVIVNDCPSKATGNKDRITILSLAWEGAAASHTHEYTSTTTASCTQAGVTTYTCACGDTYTEEVEKLGHVDEDLDVSCDREGCTSKIAPKADTTISLFTANNLGAKLSTSNMYYVEGTIVQMDDAKNGIFWIADETGEKFYVRMPKDEAGNAHSSWPVKLHVGDKVRLYGKVGKFSAASVPGGYYPSMSSSPVLVALLEQHPHDFSFSPADCTNPSYCDCGQSHGEALSHIDEDANNACDRCQWRMDASLEKIKTHYNDVKDTPNLDTANGTILWEGTEFNVLISKGSSSLNTNSTNYIRFQNLNELTVSATNGKKMISITFVATSTSYVDELELVLGTAGYTCTTDGLEVTVSLDSVEIFTLTNTSKKVARFSDVLIAYVSAS